MFRTISPQQRRVFDSSNCTGGKIMRSLSPLGHWAQPSGWRQLFGLQTMFELVFESSTCAYFDEFISIKTWSIPMIFRTLFSWSREQKFARNFVESRQLLSCPEKQYNYQLWSLKNFSKTHHPCFQRQYKSVVTLAARNSGVVFHINVACGKSALNSARDYLTISNLLHIYSPQAWSMIDFDCTIWPGCRLRYT